MAAYRRPTSESKELRGAPSSTGRKALEVGDDGSGRCGICSAHISVCGVLDCCSHEYCFDCIENWSSVSNQCPLCKLQFRFISVENVYDEDVVEDHVPFAVDQGREEEEVWHGDGALRFSFPSFFIDEDAVACLEGNQCLVRAGVPLPDEDAADTSVACDSCDRWYHAGCVGFDPSISWGSWLCPRCSAKKAANRSHQPPASFSPVLPPIPPALHLTTVVPFSASERVPVAELASNATVFSEHDPSVSVVGEGESALVLSTCRAPEPTALSSPEIIQASTLPDSRGEALVVVKAEEVAYPPLEDQASRIQAREKLAIEGQKPVDAPSDVTRADPSLVDRAPKGGAASSLTSPGAALPDLAKVPLQALQTEDANPDQGNESKLSESAVVPASYFDSLDLEEQPVREKRKQTTKQDRDFVRAEDLPEPPRKIARSGVRRKETRSTSEKTGAPSPKRGSKASIPQETSPVDHLPYTENVPLEDLVLMVKDGPTVETGLVKDEHFGSNSAGGVRTRVVMRRDTDGRAAQIVEDIRQQMSFAAGYDKVAVSDDRFFAAYKAAMVRSNERSQGVKSQGLKRRRNSWLHKMLDKAPAGRAGGVRESLTKKLYAGGVARKTWDRDWDISFWKEQSARIKKAKQEATEVVDGRGRDGVVVKKEDAVLEKFNGEGDSILSRLYVADTSLFPRDHDIKPLYLLGNVKEEGKAKSSGGEKATSEPKSVLKSQPSKPTVAKPSRTGDASAIPPQQGLKGPPRDTNKGLMKGSELPKLVDAPTASELDEKKDKRQWARELLARKSGDAMASSSTKLHGGAKKESSLLGQVPEELRPTLPPDRRSRIPTAVRQSQLNRLLEHYLRRAKLTSLQSGYKLKSVISSAVTKELEIYESSNSKGVYVNLCVRALAQQDDVRLQVTIPEPDGAAAVTEALLATGLISDSPPGSPQAPDAARAEAPDVEDMLEIFNPAASDLDLGFEMASCEGSMARAPPSHARSPKHKMKVILTSSNTMSSSQVARTNEESTTGREADMDAKAGVAPADHQRGRISTHEEKDVYEHGTRFSHGRKTEETSPGEEVAGAESSKPEDGDDWMDSGKFPDLDSRIDKMRTDVLKMSSSSFLSQFNEEHAFGASVSQEGGRGVKGSTPHAGVPPRKGGTSHPEPETSSAVQKQVEAYVKEHLKPLYKSGVIKSDQFRFAVSKTACKVMQHHGEATSADFLIVEGSKVKKLADQYLQSYVQKK